MFSPPCVNVSSVAARVGGFSSSVSVIPVECSPCAEDVCGSGVVLVLCDVVGDALEEVYIPSPQVKIFDMGKICFP